MACPTRAELTSPVGLSGVRLTFAGQGYRLVTRFLLTWFRYLVELGSRCLQTCCGNCFSEHLCARSIPRQFLGILAGSLTSLYLIVFGDNPAARIQPEINDGCYNATSNDSRFRHIGDKQHHSNVLCNNCMVYDTQGSHINNQPCRISRSCQYVTTTDSGEQNTDNQQCRMNQDYHIVLTNDQQGKDTDNQQRSEKEPCNNSLFLPYVNLWSIGAQQTHAKSPYPSLSHEARVFQNITPADSQEQDMENQPSHKDDTNNSRRPHTENQQYRVNQAIRNVTIIDSEAQGVGNQQYRTSKACQKLSTTDSQKHDANKQCCNSEECRKITTRKSRNPENQQCRISAASNDFTTTNSRNTCTENQQWVKLISESYSLQGAKSAETVLKCWHAGAGRGNLLVSAVYNSSHDNNDNSSNGEISHNNTNINNKAEDNNTKCNKEEKSTSNYNNKDGDIDHNNKGEINDNNNRREDNSSKKGDNNVNNNNNSIQGEVSENHNKEETNNNSSNSNNNHGEDNNREDNNQGEVNYNNIKVEVNNNTNGEVNNREDNNQGEVSYNNNNNGEVSNKGDVDNNKGEDNNKEEDNNKGEVSDNNNKGEANNNNNKEEEKDTDCRTDERLFTASYHQCQTNACMQTENFVCDIMNTPAVLTSADRVYHLTSNPTTRLSGIEPCRVDTHLPTSKVHSNNDHEQNNHANNSTAANFLTSSSDTDNCEDLLCRAMSIAGVGDSDIVRNVDFLTECPAKMEDSNPGFLDEADRFVETIFAESHRLPCAETGRADYAMSHTCTGQPLHCPVTPVTRTHDVGIATGLYLSNDHGTNDLLSNPRSSPRSCCDRHATWGNQSDAFIPRSDYPHPSSYSASHSSDSFSNQLDSFSRPPELFTHLHDPFSHNQDSTVYDIDFFSRGVGSYGNPSESRNHGSTSFSYLHDSFSHGPNSFSNRPDSFRHLPDSTSHGLDSFSHFPDSTSNSFNSFCHLPDSTSHGLDSFSHLPISTSHGLDSFSHPPDSTSHGLDSFRHLPDSTSHGLDSFRHLPDSTSHGLDYFSHLPDSTSHGLDSFSHLPDSVSHGLDSFSHLPDSVSHGFESFSNLPDSFSNLPDTRCRLLDSCGNLPDHLRDPLFNLDSDRTEPDTRGRLNYESLDPGRSNCKATVSCEPSCLNEVIITSLKLLNHSDPAKEECWWDANADSRLGNALAVLDEPLSFIQDALVVNEVLELLPDTELWSDQQTAPHSGEAEEGKSRRQLDSLAKLDNSENSIEDLRTQCSDTGQKEARGTPFLKTDEWFRRDNKQPLVKSNINGTRLFTLTSFKPGPTICSLTPSAPFKARSLIPINENLLNGRLRKGVTTRTSLYSSKQKHCHHDSNKDTRETQNRNLCVPLTSTKLKKEIVQLNSCRPRPQVQSSSASYDMSSIDPPGLGQFTKGSVRNSRNNSKWASDPHRDVVRMRQGSERVDKRSSRKRKCTPELTKEELMESDKTKAGLMKPKLTAPDLKTQANKTININEKTPRHSDRENSISRCPLPAGNDSLPTLKKSEKGKAVGPAKTYTNTTNVRGIVSQAGHDSLPTLNKTEKGKTVGPAETYTHKTNVRGIFSQAAISDQSIPQKNAILESKDLLDLGADVQQKSKTAATMDTVIKTDNVKDSGVGVRGRASWVARFLETRDATVTNFTQQMTMYSPGLLKGRRSDVLWDKYQPRNKIATLIPKQVQYFKNLQLRHVRKQRKKLLEGDDEQTVIRLVTAAEIDCNNHANYETPKPISTSRFKGKPKSLLARHDSAESHEVNTKQSNKYVHFAKDHDRQKQQHLEPDEKKVYLPSIHREKTVRFRESSFGPVEKPQLNRMGLQCESSASTLFSIILEEFRTSKGNTSSKKEPLPFAQKNTSAGTSQERNFLPHINPKCVQNVKIPVMAKTSLKLKQELTTKKSVKNDQCITNVNNSKEMIALQNSSMNCKIKKTATKTETNVEEMECSRRTESPTANVANGQLLDMLQHSDHRVDKCQLKATLRATGSRMKAVCRPGAVGKSSIKLEIERPNTDNNEIGQSEGNSQSGRNTKIKSGMRASSPTESTRKCASVSHHMRSDLSTTKCPVSKRVRPPLKPEIAKIVNRLASRPPSTDSKLMMMIGSWEREYGQPLNINQQLEHLVEAKLQGRKPNQRRRTTRHPRKTGHSCRVTNPRNQCKHADDKAVRADQRSSAGVDSLRFNSPGLSDSDCSQGPGAAEEDDGDDVAVSLQ